VHVALTHVLELRSSVQCVELLAAGKADAAQALAAGGAFEVLGTWLTRQSAQAEACERLLGDGSQADVGC